MLVGSATIRKIAQSLAVSLALVAGVPALATAQDDVRRPLRQVETDDGVIVLTNSTEPEPEQLPARDPSPANLQTSPARRPSAQRAGTLRVDDHAPRDESRVRTPATAAAGKVLGREGEALPTWPLPLLVIGVAVAGCVWGLRRRRRARPGVTPAAYDAPRAQFEVEDTFDAEVNDEPLATPSSSHWVEALRDGVPAPSVSAPSVSARSVSAPTVSSAANLGRSGTHATRRQWVSQSLRVKPDGS